MEDCKRFEIEKKQIKQYMDPVLSKKFPLGSLEDFLQITAKIGISRFIKIANKSISNLEESIKNIEEKKKRKWVDRQINYFKVRISFLEKIKNEEEIIDILNGKI